MRILILTQTFPLSPTDPTAYFMYDFAKGFSEIGHEVFVVLPFHPNLKVDSFKEIKLIPFKYIWPDSLSLLGFGQTLKPNSKLTLLAYFLIPFYFIFCFITLFKVIKKFDIDVVNAHWIIPNGFIASLVCKLLNKPLFITIPGSDAFISRQNIFFMLTSKIAALVSSGLISNSPQLLKDLNLKGTIIPYGISENFSKRIINHNVRLASAGRIIEKKGFELLKKAYPEIEILSGLPNKVLLNKLLGVDIFILSTIRDRNGNIDGSPIVLSEAMAAGCAVIATDTPGSRVVLENMKTGVLVKADVRSIKKAVERLKKDSKLRNRLGKAARNYAEENLLKENIAKRYLEYFQKFMPGKP